MIRANGPPPLTAVKYLRRLIDRQAEDHGLWFEAQTAPEAYLQQELRKLHAAIERVDWLEDFKQRPRQ